MSRLILDPVDQAALFEAIGGSSEQTPQVACTNKGRLDDSRHASQFEAEEAHIEIGVMGCDDATREHSEQLIDDVLEPRSVTDIQVGYPVDEGRSDWTARIDQGIEDQPWRRARVNPDDREFNGTIISGAEASSLKINDRDWRGHQAIP
jgi:hypothetical protein